MGLAKWFLGMELVQTDGCIELLQTAYIERFCKDLFGITKEDQAAAATPWDPNIKLSAKDIPESEEEREKLRKKFPGTGNARSAGRPELGRPELGQG